MKNNISTVLTIAGSDSGGGAGIQADLKTFAAHNVFGMTAITAITAQNTKGVQSIDTLSLKIIYSQIESVVSDVRVDAVKTGMLVNTEIIKMVTSAIISFKLKNVVIDPVMTAKSGDALLSFEAVTVLRKDLLPLATVLTPNVPEAEALLSRKITNVIEMEKAARDLVDAGAKNVVIKGGHLEKMPAIDIFFDGNQIHRLENKRFDTKNTHGTGCTFAAAIAANLARGISPLESVIRAKKYISRAIEESFSLGSGHGPTFHNVDVKSTW